VSLARAAEKSSPFSPDLVLRIWINGAFRLVPNVLWPFIALALLMSQESRMATALIGLPLVLCWSLGVGAGLAELRSHRRHALLPDRWRLFVAGLAAVLILTCGIALLTFGEPGAWPLVLAGGLFGLGLGLAGGWTIAPVALMLLVFPVFIALDDPLGFLEPGWALMIATVTFLAACCWHLRPLRIGPSRSRPESRRSEAAIRHGHAIGPWESVKWLAYGGVMSSVMILIVEPDLSLAQVGRTASFFLIWPLFGMMTYSGEFWRARSSVRRLSLLPGWSRQQLFSHFDRSLWRAVAWLFAGTLAILAAACFLGPASARQVIAVGAVWLAAFWVASQLTLLMLTVERWGHTWPMAVVMLPVIWPALTMVPPHRVNPEAPWIAAALIIFIASGAALRHFARQRWERVSLTPVFSRA
jgi:hypothetical protein